jgi:hypothetical protein
MNCLPVGETIFIAAAIWMVHHIPIQNDNPGYNRESFGELFHCKYIEDGDENFNSKASSASTARSLLLFPLFSHNDNAE